MPEPRVPGDGQMGVLDMLKGLPGCSGWIVAAVELDPKMAQPAIYVGRSQMTLPGFLAKAGLV